MQQLGATTFADVADADVRSVHDFLADFHVGFYYPRSLVSYLSTLSCIVRECVYVRVCASVGLSHLRRFLLRFRVCCTTLTTRKPPQPPQLPQHCYALVVTTAATATSVGFLLMSMILASVSVASYYHHTDKCKHISVYSDK